MTMTTEQTAQLALVCPHPARYDATPFRVDGQRVCALCGGRDVLRDSAIAVFLDEATIADLFNVVRIATEIHLYQFPELDRTDAELDADDTIERGSDAVLDRVDDVCVAVSEMMGAERILKLCLADPVLLDMPAERVGDGTMAEALKHLIRDLLLEMMSEWSRDRHNDWTGPPRGHWATHDYRTGEGFLWPAP